MDSPYPQRVCVTGLDIATAGAQPNESDGARAVELLKALNWIETYLDNQPLDQFAKHLIREKCREAKSRAFVQARREKGTTDASD